MFFLVSIPSMILATMIPKKDYLKYFYFCFPLFFLTALQYEVGTDYWSYFDRSLSGDSFTFDRKYEYGFSLLNTWSSRILPGQGIFILSALLQYVFLYVLLSTSAKYLNIKSTSYVIFVAFSIIYFGSAGVNQFNLLRFFIALPIFFLSCVCLLSGWGSFYLFFVLLGISAQFHASMILFGILFLFLKVFRFGFFVSFIFGLLLFFNFVFIGSVLSEYYNPVVRFAGGVNFGLENFISTKFINLVVFIYLSIYFKKFIYFRALLSMVWFFVPFLVLSPPELSSRLWHFSSYAIFLLFGFSFYLQVSGSGYRVGLAFGLLLFVALKYLIFAEREYVYDWILL